MKLMKHALAVAVLAIASTSAAHAACGIAAGRVNVVGNEFQPFNPSSLKRPSAQVVMWQSSPT
jgi:P pilus assembly chaperone PapD